jgi:hypothetical protein
MSIPRVLEYLQAIGLYWWVALAVLLAMERLAERWFHGFWKTRVDPWFTPERRKQVLIFFASAAFVIANLRAWNEEREAKIAAEQKLAASAPSEERWAALTGAEASTLAARVRSLPSGDIVIACETRNCRELADGIADILKRMPGWKVTILHSGGLGISGVTGVLVNPDEPATRLLKDAIESATTLKVTMGRDTRQMFGNDPIFLVIGNKPF